MNPNRLRPLLVQRHKRRIRLSRIEETRQSKDLRAPVQCNGFARIRHFALSKSQRWTQDPLPLIPAAKALSVTPDAAGPACVFQIAACDFRCWYCFVGEESLNPRNGINEFISVDDMLECFFSLEDRVYVLDLSGGNPALVPEWPVWILQTIEKRWPDEPVYVWIDDNLAGDYYREYLTNDEIEVLAGSQKFGSVACFKGFDTTSFTFNTGVSECGYARQFQVFRSIYSLGWDIYAYVTFTTPTLANLNDKIAGFLDKLQEIDEMLPLRTVPLEIKVYTPTEQRMTEARRQAITNQYKVLDAWIDELRKRYRAEDTSVPIADVRLRAVRSVK